MSLSFKDSLEKNNEIIKPVVATESATAAAFNVEDMDVEPYGVMTLEEDFGGIAAYAGDDGFITDTSYKQYYYFENKNGQSNKQFAFSDDNISEITSAKEIKIDSNQFNITQEENSQYIPFKMPRYYDGVDLTAAALSIHYVRSDGKHGVSIPINVKYNDNEIRFGWLIDGGVTSVSGKIKFEVRADGMIVYNEGSERIEKAYTWKTRYNGDLNVLESLCGYDCNNAIEINESWVQELIDSVVEKVATQIAGVEIGGQIEAANQAAKDAAEAAERAQDSAEVAASVANTAVTEALKSYATTKYVDDQLGNLVDDENNPLTVEAYVSKKIEEVDVSDQIGDLGTNDDNTEKTVKQYVDEAVGSVDISDKLGSLVDNEGNELTVEAYVQQEVASVDVSDQLGNLGTDDEGTPLTVVDYVEKKVNEVDVSDQLGELGTNEDGTDKTVKDYVDEAVSNVSVDLSGYATTSSLNEVKTSLETVIGNTVTNATNIATVQNDIAAIQSTLSSLEGDNKNLIIQYDEVGSVLHLYEKDENGDITITDGDEQIKVKEVYSTIITGAGGGATSLVSTVKLGLSADGKDSLTVLYGNDTSLNYKLSTKKAKETQDENGKDITVYEEAVIPGDITLTLYRDNVYLTHFTVTKTSSEVQSGSVDISDFIALGNQVFTIKASYVEQLGEGESITVRSSEDWAVNAVRLDIVDLPDSTWETTPKYGNVTFSYTPIGALEKTICFQIDEEEPETVLTSLNGTGLTYTISQQTHGTHTLKVWCQGYVGETFISTEPHKYVLMFVEDGNDTPIVRIKAPTALEQYSSDYIYYNIFDPSNPIIDLVTICDEEGVILSSVENITSAEQKYLFRPSVAKNKTITIKYKEVAESVAIEVTKFPYEINAVTDGLMVDFVPTGRTNSDIDYNVFKNNAYTVEKDTATGEETKKEIPMTWTFSDNFDWVNGGWKTDINGDAYFCVKSGTSVDINYNLFGTDGVIAKKDANGDYTIAGTGKEFKLIFKTANVAQADATWLSCVDVADKKSLGIRMEAQNAYIDSGLGTLEIPYVDNDIIEFDMNIVPVTQFLESGEPDFEVKAIPMIMTYEDGTPVQPKVINSASTSFKQDSPKPITIGSEYCDVHIYRMKIYEKYLSDKEIITNFIADARSGVEMAQRYIKNDIYPVEDKQRITPESVAAACPDLKVYVLSAPYFTNDKGNKIEGTTIRQIHNTGTREKPEYDASENWTATGATHNGQGTSSNEYGYSGRNLEFNMKKATITLNDNTTVVKNIQLSPTSYPTNYLNFKINVASSEHSNNALLQKRYDRYLPYTSVASLIDDRKKNSMEFFNCVVFIQETDGDISTHREFSDTDIHFYGIGNIGDSKKTDDSRVNDVNDPNEFCVEIMDWNRYLSSFPADTMVSTLYSNEDGVPTLRFEHLLIDDNLGADGILYEKDARGNYYHSTDATVDKTKTYYIDILENDDFSEEYTYGFRYIQKEWKKEDDADYKAKNETFQRPLRQKWIDFYRFVTRDLTTNGKEDGAKIQAWKSEFSNWFILDSALYYYLYTLRYTMVDNRAKNTFWHWCKHYLTLEEALAKGIAVYDADKNLITDASNPSSRFYDKNGKEIKNINAAEAAINNGYRMEFWAYDNDTALGIDNAGKLEIPIGVEDDDVDFAGVPYFRAHDSLVFVRIAKYFVDELEDAWHNTEINPIGKVFDSTSFINEFDAWQNQFPEELWRIAYERQYKRTYVGGTGADWDNALPQSNKSDIVSTRFLTEMMNGRKKYQRRCFERNQEIYMSSKFKGEVNLNDTVTLRGTGRPTGKVVTPNFTLNIVPFSKMYVNLYNATDNIYYHEKHEAGDKVSVAYPNTNLDFIYIRGASQMQSLGDLSPMYLQTAELTSGAKLKTIKLGNATTGYSNDSLKTLQIGAGNKLLEELDIRNLSNLSPSNLPVSNIPSLKRVYAQGSNISEAVFANNGLLEEAYLPETITRLELRNLYYLNKIELESYDNLLHLVVMNCPTMNSRILEIINQASELQTLRVTNVNWTFDNTDVLERLYGLIKNSDSPEVVLSGTVHLTQIKEYDKLKYENVWNHLIIDVPDSGIVRQHMVTFINANDTPLLNADGTPMIQYVTVNEKAVDPSKYDAEGKPLFPTIASDVEYDYVFKEWQDSNGNVFDFNTLIRTPITLKAVYTPTQRTYKIRYVTKTNTIELNGLYGSNIPYDFNTHGIPTYTGQEGANTFHLFSHWDKSGFLLDDEYGTDLLRDGIKVVNAVYDVFEYDETISGLIEKNENISINGSHTIGSFKGVELSDLSPVHIYALTKLGVNNVPFGKLTDGSYEGFLDGKPYEITVGNDVDYIDIESQVLIDKKTIFNGKNTYIDTGITLFKKDEDRDFVLAIDYEFSKDCSLGATLAQCYDGSQSQGFNLTCNDSGAQLSWGNASNNVSEVGKREMIILRHKKGDNNLTIYKSNLDGEDVVTTPLISQQVAITDAKLIFGASNPEEGYYENYAVGNINWAKIWYADLGDEVCKSLAMWTRESIDLQVCGTRRYFLMDDSGNVTNQRCSFSLLASHLLGRTKRWNSSADGNKGGWANSELNKSLNTRLYDAMPIQIKLLLKRMAVRSSIGGGTTSKPSEDISTSGCYITIPALIELDSAYGNTQNHSVAYGNEINAVTGINKTISYLTGNASRKRAFDDGDYYEYWTRSPLVNYNYVWKIDKDGIANGYNTVTSYFGVLIEISF